MLKDPIPDNIIDMLMSYEDGRLTEPQTAELFQTLINTGLAKQFGDEYELKAKSLIAAGICKVQEEIKYAA